ncbi:hypothetical protein [Breoghania sp.]|uniref:hypothetical protein n=1 Tax=Breoghania sp. TaxID=2065378 RepID=UPI002AA9566D|nr:hypothetical protein [Breoghania sp.]
MAETPTTANRGYPKLSLNNTPVEDVPRTNGALDGIDADVANILVELATKALIGHGHTIEEITNLASTLASLAPLNHNHDLAGLSDVNLTGAPADRPLVTTSGGTIGFGPAIATAAAQLAIAAISGLSAENVQEALAELAAGKVSQVEGAGEWAGSRFASLDGIVSPGNGFKIRPSHNNSNMFEYLTLDGRRVALMGVLNENSFLIRLYNPATGAFRNGLRFYLTGELTYDATMLIDNAGRMAAPLADSVTGTTRATSDKSTSVATTAFVHHVADHLLWVRDERTIATPGGSPPATGTWFARNLNTIEANSITGSNLAANQITLPAGTYLVSATAVVHRSGLAKLRLHNLTAGRSLIESAVVNASNSTYDAILQHLHGRIELTVPSVIELQQVVTYDAGNNQTLGLASTIGAASVFADMIIRKV